MRMTTCMACNRSNNVASDRGVIELDERATDAVRAFLREPASPIACTECGQSLGCEPVTVLWRDRRSGVDLVEGGPWADGKTAQDVWPVLAEVEIHRYDTVAALRAALDKRYLTHLDTVEAVAANLDSEDLARPVAATKSVLMTSIA